MRVAFAGTPEFAERILVCLIEAGHDVRLVLTQPDKPAGRGQKLAPSPVKQAALARGLDVFQPPTLRDPAATARLEEVRADVLAVAAYGLILPQAVLDLPRFGAINVHASLLPRWRGAAPIQRAILEGDAETGVTIMGMEAGLDTGPMYLRRAIPIGADDDTGTLHDRLAALGGAMLVEVLAGLEAGHLSAEPQPSEGVTYARKIEKNDLRLDWSRPASSLERAIRAFRPSPGAWTTIGGQPVKIWSARVVPGHGNPGTILNVDAGGITIACGSEALLATELQRAGSRRMPAADFLRGTALVVGDRAE